MLIQDQLFYFLKDNKGRGYTARQISEELNLRLFKVYQNLLLLRHSKHIIRRGALINPLKSRRRVFRYFYIE